DDFVNKVCKFEMISRRKVSPTSSVSSPSSSSSTTFTATTKSPTTSVGKSPTSSKIFFSSDGWKGGGGGRGSSGSAGSGSGSGSGGTSSVNAAAGNPTIPLMSPYSPRGFVGEKVFTRDTATTRVSASLLQNLASPSAPGAGGSKSGQGQGQSQGQSQGQVQGQTPRVPSSEINGCGTTSSNSNSFTSVSSLSWTSDRSDIMSSGDGQSRNRSGSGGGGGGTGASKREIIYDDVPTPVPSPRVLPAHVTNRHEAAKHRGGVFEPPEQPSSTSEALYTNHQNQNNSSSNSNRSPSRVTPTRETPKRFVTLSSSDRDSFPTPVVTPLSPSGNANFPYISPGAGASSTTFTPAANSPSPSSSSSEHTGPLGHFTNGDGSGSSGSHHLPLYSAAYSSNRDSIRSGSSTGSGGGHVGSAKTSSSSSASSHRNTFEGMDFEFQELTSQQQQLALRHREVVAERKREQERERMDRQRLEDILKMCEEYQHEVETARPTSSDQAPPTRDKVPPTRDQAPPTRDQAPPTRDQAPPPYSQIESEQPPPPYSPTSSQTATSPRPPGQLNINTSLASSPTSSIDRKNKIKTNGSLMLGSPGSPYKEFASTSFSYPSQGLNSPHHVSTATASTASAASSASATCRTKESSSAYSSNSEDEAVGSSEDTGTIKKRPGMGDGIAA
ncbi:hypothetical protein EGW08_018013, partial [Elysia chlorotica]